MKGPHAIMEEVFFSIILPVVANLKVPEHNEGQIAACAHTLASHCAVLVSMGHLPGLTYPSKPTPESLKNLKNSLELVAKRLRELSETAIEKIEEASLPVGRRRPPDIWDFQDDVSDLSRIVELAHRNVVSEPKPAIPQKPKMVAAHVISEQARIVYEELTGEKATRRVKSSAGGHPAYGPFLEFLSGMFEALKIDASADYFANKVINHSKAKQVRTTQRKR